MYVPHLFRDENTETLLEFMRRNSFATVISTSGDEPTATHLPLVVKQGDEMILIRGHFAKANPHWKVLEAGPTLAVFSGPHAYISPRLYESVNSVPTWNYQAVHAWGPARIVDGDQTLCGILELIEQQEPEYRHQWDQLPDDYRSGMLRGVVGFEMQVTRLVGKSKLSQNKSSEEQLRVAAALAASEDGAARATGEEMQRRLGVRVADQAGN